MIVECKKCGAPLDLAEGKTFTQCRYCQTPQQVREMRTISPHTPDDFQAPAQWPGNAQTSLTLVATLIFLLLLGGAAFMAIWIQREAAVAEHSGPRTMPGPVAASDHAVGAPAVDDAGDAGIVTPERTAVTGDDPRAVSAKPRPVSRPTARPTTPIVSKEEAKAVLEPELMACMRTSGTYHMIVRIGQGYAGKQTGPLRPLTVVDNTVVNYADAPQFDRSALGKCVAAAIAGLRADTQRGNYIYFGLINKAATDPLAGVGEAMDRDAAAAAMGAQDEEARECGRRHPESFPEGRAVQVQATFRGVDGKVTAVDPLYLESRSPYAKCLTAAYRRATVPRFRRLAEKLMHKLTP